MHRAMFALRGSAGSGMLFRAGYVRQLTGSGEQVISKIGAKHHELKSEYESVGTNFPEHSFDPKDEGGMDELTVRRKRILYRSRQRGWLEVDLMLGKFAEKNVMSMPVEELDQYEQILAQETIDIFKIVTGAKEAPSEVKGPALERLMRFCETQEMRELSHYQ
eukprot:g1555.t1